MPTLAVFDLPDAMNWLAVSNMLIFGLAERPMYIGYPAPICSWGRSAANAGSNETNRLRFERTHHDPSYHVLDSTPR